MIENGKGLLTTIPLKVKGVTNIEKNEAQHGAHSDILDSVVNK